MRTLESWRARDAQTAARTAVPILLVCAVALIAFTMVGPSAGSFIALVSSWVSALLLTGLAGACVLLPGERLDRWGAYGLIAVIGVVMVCSMNLLTKDASAAAQAFLSFPVLWAAVNLERAAVGGVTALALAMDGVVLFHLEDPVAALTDGVFFGAVLVVIAVMLVRAGDEQARLVGMLHEQATVDALTGLTNRRVLDAALSAALTSGNASPGTALVLIDVDSFKSINDRYGHPVGDDALAHIAGVLRSVVRAGDGVLSRMGGDELAVLLTGCAPDVAVRRATEVLDAVRAQPLVLADGTLLSISVSLGVAHAPSHADGLEELYAAADAALYAAKRAGRGRVEVAALS